MIVAVVMIYARPPGPCGVDSHGARRRRAYDEMMKRVALIAAWILAVLVVVFTLGPVSDRPQFGHPQGERFIGFFALGLCWAAAYPGRAWRVLLGLLAAAAMLEAAQGLVPGRDPGAPDALAKMAGAAVAVAIVAGARRTLQRQP